MNFDEFINKQIIKDKYLDNKYPEYFQPEIEPFLNLKWFPKYDENSWILEIQKEISSDFFDKRKIGENDEFICRLIQKVLIEEFITSVTSIGESAFDGCSSLTQITIPSSVTSIEDSAFCVNSVIEFKSQFLLL